MFSADNSTPFFNNLCEEQIISSCRFGLALNTNGTGSLTLGQVNDDLFEGNLTTTPIVEEWFTFGDIVNNGDVLATNATIELDSGTPNIVGYVPILSLSLVPSRHPTDPLCPALLRKCELSTEPPEFELSPSPPLPPRPKP